MGQVFGGRGYALTCFDAEGVTSNMLVPNQSEVSIAPDGATWLLGEQVARLPGAQLPWPVGSNG
jgi:hypothetical protein